MAKENSSPVTTTHGSQLSQSSVSSGLPSPTSPTFSTHGHSRLPDSTSSIASSPGMRQSFEGYANTKRPLTEVMEEPHEKDDDYETIQYPVGLGLGRDCKPERTIADIVYRHLRRNRITDLNHSGNDFMATLDAELKRNCVTTVTTREEYDLADDIQADYDYPSNPVVKKRRGAPSFSFNNLSSNLSSRIGSRMPSISRKHRPQQSMPDSPRESQIGSTRVSRAPSLSSSYHATPDTQAYKLNPSPTVVPHGTTSDLPMDDWEEASAEIDEAREKAPTPLLPPIMTQLKSHVQEESIQSPLQSPSIADPESSVSRHGPFHGSGLPSPPLSTKPSISSFHYPRTFSSPPAEVPPLSLTEPDDYWSDNLGHANFTIFPEPYTPTEFTLAELKQIRANWDQARRDYTKHLMRTSQNHGSTSNIYRLTQQKWDEVQALWKQNHDLCYARTKENMTEAGEDVDSSMSASDESMPPQPQPLTKLPPLNGPRSEGKFPKLGEDQDIVGPMEQLPSPISPSQQQRRPGKRRWWSFWTGMLPHSAGGRG